MGCLGSTDWRTLARRIRKQEEKAMVSGVYRLPTMENVIFRKRFVELLAQEVDRVDYGLYAAMRLPTSARSIALSRCRSRRAKEA
jgi:hypothetical protein